MTEPAQIFVSYAHKDRDTVENIYRDLQKEGFKLWIDYQDILGGQKWHPAIKRAIKASTFFLACMSPNSFKRRGVLQREIKTALDEAEELLDDDVFVIPVWIGTGPIPDDLPEKLGELQWVSMSDSGGWRKLLRSLRKQLERLGQSVSGPSPAPDGDQPAASTFPADAFVDGLKEAMADGDEAAAAESVLELVEYLGWTDEVFPAREADRILRHLRKKRWLSLGRTVAEGLLLSGQKSPPIRRHYAELLLEDEICYGALEVLEELHSETSADPTENARVKALYGSALARCYLYADIKSGTRVRGLLEKGVRSYLEVYDSDPRRHLAHGVRAAALLCRAQRDLIELTGVPDPVRIAEEILDAIHDREELEGPLALRECGVAAEACLAVGDPAAAARWVQRFVDHPVEDLAETAALHRNLREVWQLDAASPEDRPLVLPLQQTLRVSAGGPPPKAAQRGPAEQAEVPGTPSGLEAVVSRELEVRTLEWTKAFLSRGLAVAKICDARRQPAGTGFLLRGADLHPRLGEGMVLLTAASVTSPKEVRSTLRFQALPPEEALIEFTGLGGDERREGRVEEVLFSSPLDELDTTLVRLDRAFEGVDPLPIARGLPAPDSAQEVFVIGHPQGGALSLATGRLLDHEDRRVHYRVPTEPGSGGSPVFDENFELIALHHAAGSRMSRLRGKSGTYEAAEGIWIQSIIQALARTLEREG